MTGPPRPILSATQVILSAAKDLRRKSGEILRYAQNDRRGCAQNDRRGNRPHYLLRAFTTMQLRRSIGRRSARRATRGGFSLLEMMVAMVVVGILVAISAPSYQKAIEQSRTNIAAANLRAIWAAQRLYWLENHSYTPAIAPPSSAPALITMGLVDPALPTASNKVTYQNGGYYYEITNASDATFTAKATRASDGTLISVDQDGNWSVPDNVTLSFQ